MSKLNKQVLYINIDDSGKVSIKEKIAVYGGILFLSKNERDKFITQYRSIINDMKCRYCPLNKNICNNKNCPELKHSNLKSSDLRRLRNYIKKYFSFAVIISNKKIYAPIISNKASKGRYLDYTLRRLIKGLIIELIENKKINPNKPLRIILNMDEQTTKSNGYYNLKEGLYEELKYGIINYNYATKHQPIIFNDLDIHLTFQKSDRSFAVQAADLVAGSTRRNALNNLEKRINFLNYKIFLP